jgi:DNA-directed RNA polymerase subunit RPC12/RpoP
MKYMNDQAQQLSSCPECGGKRVLLQYETDQGKSVYLHIGLHEDVMLYASICLACGATALLPSPGKMGEVRKWTEKPVIFMR